MLGEGHDAKSDAEWEKSLIEVARDNSLNLRGRKPSGKFKDAREKL